jgi:2-furoyl-CoA dehydrogenase FAD binding subunit
VKPAPFAYAAPSTVAEALELISDSSTDARIIAGGQTLGPMLNMRIATPSLLVDINRIRDLTAPAGPGSSVMIDALARQSDVLASASIRASVPLLSFALPFVGHYQTRNRGTVCGSIAHADPSAELPLALLTLGGCIHLASAERRRKIAAIDFFIGPLTTERSADEMIVATEWPVAARGAQFSFREIGMHGSHSALCACAISADFDEAGTIRSLAIGVAAVSDRPVLVDTWEFLNSAGDSEWCASVAASAKAKLSFIDDLHASARYRRHITGVLIERGLADVIEGNRKYWSKAP